MLIFSVTMVFNMFFVSSYAEQNLTVNGENVSKGDTVTFSYYMSGVDSPIEAAGAYLYYNHEYLEYIDGSIGFDVLQNAMVNVGEESIYYCAINVTNGFDFKEEGLVVTASFKVLDTAEGATLVKNTFDEIFTFENEDEDLTENDYNSRTVISVNGSSDNAAVHSGIDANNVTETFDIAVTSENNSDVQAESPDNNVLASIIIGAVIVLIASAAAFVFLLKKKKQKMT